MMNNNFVSQSNPSFSAFQLGNGLLHDASNDEFGSKLYAFDGGKKLTIESYGSSFFGFVYKGYGYLKANEIDQCFPVEEGMYFSCSNKVEISACEGIIIQKTNHKCFFHIGGKIEEKGRLKYIDQCTDSLLISPIKKGDACLNALFFLKNIDQTPHTHPSKRIGMVVKGTGLCKTPFGNLPLKAGMVFIIHQSDGKQSKGLDGKLYDNGTHSFQTFDGDELVVIAFHPDSDFGPEDVDHPMINRTIVNGVSAREIDEIRTK